MLDDVVQEQEKRLVGAHISKLLILLNTAKRDGAERTAKEIEEMITEAKEYETIIPF